MHSDSIMTTPAAESTPVTEILLDDMKFNDGHRMAIVTYSVLMVVSAVGNLTVLITILRRRRALRMSNNHMFMHLAIADLLVTFLMMPLEIGWNTTVTWQAGDSTCRIMSFFRAFGLYLSSFVIVSISLDRCFAILRPMANVVNVARRGKVLLVVAWSLATLCSLPQVVIFHVERHPKFTWYEQCVAFNMFPTKLHELTYRVLGMIMMYGLPLVVIIISYACILAEIFRRYQLSPDDSFRRSSFVFLNRARSRTLKMAITIFVVFFICWTPYHVMCLWYWIDEASAKTVDQRVQKGLFLFACTNSCMNPIVYGYFNFRPGRGSGYRVPWQRAGPQVRTKWSREVEGAASFPRFPSEKNPGAMQLQHQQHVTPLSAAILTASTTVANSRRGSNCSSICRNNTNQNMYRQVPLVHRNSHGVDQSITRSNSQQTTSFTVTNNMHSNSRNNQQTTNEMQPNSTTNNHTSTTTCAVEDTNCL